MYKGKSDKAAAVLAQAARINRTSLPEGRLVTLEEKEYHLQLSKERQAILPEATAHRDDQIIADEAANVSMAMGVLYRKEVADSCHGDEDTKSQEDNSVNETIEMVVIASDSDRPLCYHQYLRNRKRYVCLFVINICTINNFVQIRLMRQK